MEIKMTFRETIEAKLKWVLEQKTKGLEVIENQLQQLKDNKENITMLDGMIYVLQELLEHKEEENKVD